jgi:hypothetical protein
MRNLTALSDRVDGILGQKFVDADANYSIKCAFDLNKNCTPNCACCTISAIGSDASCCRIPNMGDGNRIIGKSDKGS